MYLRLGDRVINTDNIVEARVIPATPAGTDDETGEKYRATLLRVEVVTTATDSRYDDGGDLPEFAHTEIRPYTYTLAGDEADRFLKALPVYEPVAGE